MNRLVNLKRRGMRSLAVVLLLAPLRVLGHSVEAVNICDLLAAPAKYDGHLVTLRALTEGAWFEGAYFYDAKCIDRGRLFLGDPLDDADEAALHQLAEKARSAYQSSEATTAHRVVAATIVGRFEFRPAEANQFQLRLQGATDIEQQVGRTDVPPIPAPPPNQRLERP